MRRLLPTLALLAALGAYGLDRTAVLSGSGHLLFDLNPAEQGFIRVVSPWLDQPLDEILGGPRARTRFLRDSQAVGNQVHGTLALSLAGVHAAGRLGAPLGTLTLRWLALAASTAALGLWMVTLWRRTRTWTAPLVFAALFTVAPPVLLKLSLVHWGTHEVVLLLHAGGVLALSRGLDHQGGPAGAAGTAALAGGLAALGLLANASLLLPAAAAAAWVCLSRRPGALLLRGALAACTFALTLGLLRASGWLEGLGQPDQLLGAPLLVGKQGRSFLLSQDQAAGAVAFWGPELAARAMPLVPGPGYGQHAATLEPLVRAGVGLMGIFSGLRLLWLRDPRPGDRLAGFLGLYLVAGWLAVTVLSQTHGLDPGILGGIQPRYYAHLYPVALAVVALWAARARWRLAVAALLVFLGSVDHVQLMDARQPWPPQEAAVGRCDATAGWLRAHSDRAPPAGRLPHGDASDAFLDGLLLVEDFQFTDYWRWHRPAQVTAERVAEAARQRSRRLPDRTADPDFQAGLDLAQRCLAPAAP